MKEVWEPWGIVRPSMLGRWRWWRNSFVLSRIKKFSPFFLEKDRLVRRKAKDGLNPVLKFWREGDKIFFPKKMMQSQFVLTKVGFFAWKAWWAKK